MLHVVLTALLLPAPSGDAQRSFCRSAWQMRQLNLPANNTSQSTEIAHASVIYVGDRFVGFLYATQSAGEYLHFGPVGEPSNVAFADERLAAGALGAQASSGFQRLTPEHASLVGVNIMACY